jgi:hypothetical protein
MLFEGARRIAGDSRSKKPAQGGVKMYKSLIQTNIPIFHRSIIPSGVHETCSIYAPKAH